MSISRLLLLVSILFSINFPLLGGPTSPNPGLKYWYPLPKLNNPQTYHVDVCVYGGTPGGVAAAVQSARMGKSAMLASFGRHIGGMVSGGLTATDMGNPKAAGGLAREFYYKRLPRASNFSPALAEKAFESMLLESGAKVLYEHRLQSVEKQGNHITALVFENGNRVEAKMFVDASYEGDLLARAGVSFHVGREANSVYGETLNGYQVTEDHQFLFPVDPYKTPGDPASGLLPDITPGPHPSSLTGTGDKQVMAYCFRMNATTAENRIPFPKPKNYNPEDHELLLRYLTVKPDFHWPLTYQAGPVKLNEGDCNSTGPVSLDATGKSWDWPEAGYERREQIFQDHVTYDQGLMWFLANDPRVPEALRLRVQKYGLPKNEFVETGGWPHELYVRAAA